MSDPVLFIPPMLCDARVFAEQFAELSCDHAVLFAPIHAADSIEELAVSILAWAPKEFALAGAGMGGMVALEMLRRAPKRVTRLALVNTIAQADTPATAADREPLMIAARAGRFEDVLAAEFHADRFCAGADMDAMTPVLHEMARALGPDVYLRQARAVQRRKDQQAILRKIQQPALVISCDCEGESALRRQEFMAEMIPYAKHEVISGAGLLPSLEQPEKLSKVLRSWCRQPLVLR